MSQQSDVVNPTMRSRRNSGRTALLVFGVVAVVNVLTFGALAAAGALPFQFDGKPVDEVVQTTTVSGVDTPATTAVTAAVAVEVAGFSAPEATALGAGAIPTFPCSLNPPTQPVIGRYRSYSSDQQTVSVAVSAYGPGAGPWVIGSLADQLIACDAQRGDVSVGEQLEGFGVESIQARLPSASVLLMRRGDVVVQLAGNQPEVLTVARQIDAALADSMESCSDQIGAKGDENRNPWLPGVAYTGLFVDSEVTIPAVGAPTPPEGIAAVALDEPPINLPTVSIPVRPADPVWPLSLPAEVARPEPPASPGPEPIKTLIKVPQIDRVGPGCGWSFTATTAPIVNETDLNEQRDQLRTSAAAELRSQQEQWVPAVTSYYQQWARYQLLSLAYVDYTRSVGSVAAAWQKIVDDRRAYETALAAYRQAVSDRESFIANKAAAAAEYQRQLLVCATPLPTPSPTPTSSPSPTGSPSPAPSTSATTPADESDDAARIPQPTRPGCPPDRPLILDLDPPTVPAAPTPPADPRPPEYRN